MLNWVNEQEEGIISAETPFVVFRVCEFGVGLYFSTATGKPIDECYFSIWRSDNLNSIEEAKYAAQTWFDMQVEKCSDFTSKTVIIRANK